MWQGDSYYVATLTIKAIVGPEIAMNESEDYPQYPKTCPAVYHEWAIYLLRLLTEGKNTDIYGQSYK